MSKAVRRKHSVLPSPGIRALLRLVGRPYNRIKENVVKIELQDPENAVEALKRFHSEDLRLFFPFRHASRADPSVLAEAFGSLLPRMYSRNIPARRKAPFWPHFLYGRIVLQWGGAGARWLLPKLNALPVANQIRDTQLIRNLRTAVVQGTRPFLFAPEGQVTYYNGLPAEITMGLRHFIGWSLSAGKQALVVPIKMDYRIQNPQKEADNALRCAGKLAGFPLPPELALSERIRILEFVLLDRIRQKYPPQVQGKDELEPLCREMTLRNEEALKLQGKGSLLQRLFRCRVETFEKMKHLGITVPTMADWLRDHKTPKEHREWAECYRRIQILDILLLYRPNHIQYPTPERLCEQAVLLSDLANRLRGGDVNSRYTPQGRTAVVRWGNPALYAETPSPESLINTIYQTWKEPVD